MRRSLAQILSVVNIVAMIILMLVFRQNEAVMYAVVVACCVIAVILSYFMRCPHCGAWPRKGGLFHAYCPRCGEPLDD